MQGNVTSAPIMQANASAVPLSAYFSIFQLNQATGSAVNATTKPFGNFTLSRVDGQLRLLSLCLASCLRDG